MTKSKDDEEKGPLDVIARNEVGHPYHEWIVTRDGVADGWWGEGYIIHTKAPYALFKWGFTTRTENQTMSGGFGFEDGTFLSVLHIKGTRLKIESLIPAAVLAAVQALHIYEQEPRQRFTEALVEIEDEEGVDEMCNLLAVGVAACCSKINPKVVHSINVNESFAKAKITVDLRI